jgi:hypothetical protein
LAKVVGYVRGREANVGAILAIALVPIVGGVAMGTEAVSWYMMQRAQQTAADSAAITAALTSGSTSETDAVALSYGMSSGLVTITTPGCPSGANVISGSTCYQVAINRTVPIYLTRFAGYAGDATIGTAPAKYIGATAMAGLVTGNVNFCMIGLNSLKLGGGNGTDLTGCDLEAGPGGMQCSGTNSANGVPVSYSDAGIQGTCGDSMHANDTNFNYSDPVNTSAWLQKAVGDVSGCVNSPGTITSLSSGMNCFIGPVKLGANITVTSDTQLVLEASSSSGNGNPPANGGLDMNGYNLTSGTNSVTNKQAGLSILFTGSNAWNKNAYTIINGATSGSTLNIANPLTGDFHGITIAVDPNLTGYDQGNSKNTLDLTESGGANNITMDITGLIYDPKYTVNINGAINHATNGYACIGIIAYTINVTGTNSIFANPTSQCHQDNLTLNTVPMVALIH